jgi:hypothetical protein
MFTASMNHLFPMSPNPTQILFMQVSPPWVLVTSILVLLIEALRLSTQIYTLGRDGENIIINLNVIYIRWCIDDRSGT